MAVDYRFKFPLPNGLHARPASHFEAVTSRFRSSITLIHERTRFRANARSVLSMVSADIKQDDPCCVHVVGEDEQMALDAVRRFLKDELPHCDPAIAEPIPEVVQNGLPRSLVATGLKTFVRGVSASGGVGIGHAVMIGGATLPPGLASEKATDAAHERLRAMGAIAAVNTALHAKIESAQHTAESQVLKAHAAIVRDVALSERICELIADHRTAAQAIVEACDGFRDTLRNSQSAYLRERILDVEDVCTQLLDKVVRHNGIHTGPALVRPSICIADHLTPGQFLALDRRFLKGLVLSNGGLTSHTVILARSMNVPTLVGVPRTTAIGPDQEIIVDGNQGLLITEITPAIRRYYAIESQTSQMRQQRLESFRKLGAMTADGHAIEVGANIASAEEAAVAFQNGAAGIGLFRTEMLFMDRQSPPSEELQTKIYTDAAKAADDRSVIIRLIDIGGDKPAPYLNLPAETNPFLGYRGVRLYGEFASLLKTQIRAVLRAASARNVKILVPMVSCVEEVRQVRAMMDAAMAELTAEGLPCRMPPLGVMIEVPSLVFLMHELCREVDFFSIGSNDLTQYFLAADRANQKVAPLYTWSHPAFLRVLKNLVDQAKSHGRWIGLCGELADQPAVLPLLVGLGLDEISLASPRIGAVKAAIGGLCLDECQKLLNLAISCTTRAEVENTVNASAIAGRGTPLISADLIIVNSDATTKEEVIKQLSDRLYVAGRIARPQLLEEAIWKREDTYSTGFGYGFAVPHCKSDHLGAASVAIAKLSSPVEWNSLDGKPVDVVILLAIRAENHAQEHMRIFAKLSRLVMRDEFRERIRQESDTAALAAFLEQSLR
jgi:multiphosphoryl transfer protein